MSKTLKVSNGDLYFSPNTGKSESIEGYEKLSQEVAESLLNEFDPDINFGNELINQTTLATSLAMATAEVTRFVSEALDRLQTLQSNQRNLSYDEEMAGVDDLVVIPSTDGNVAFYVSIIMTSGDSIEKLMQVGQSIPLTNLKHLLPLDFNLTA